MLEIENERRLAIGLNKFDSFEEMENFKEDENDIGENDIDLVDDYLLIESTRIINDFLNLTKKTMLSSVN